MLHAWRAIRVAQPVRIVWNVVETQEGSQRHPLLETAAGGPLTGLLIVPHLIAHAANRDKQALFDDLHLRPPIGLSTINWNSHPRTCRYTYFQHSITIP